ncbi:hypothetical protein [Streptacidiphilus anmyonensis]|uniref:hypothetical protein n=1 Tax=Streptacidiphilus anmyonensis TaxID=405782 RepID=UPI0007C6D4A4|nr:hypothetical protein [Streptacidiphilus anmyonensis]
MNRQYVSKSTSVVLMLAICATFLGVILAQAWTGGQGAVGNRAFAVSASQPVTPSDLTWGN